MAQDEERVKIIFDTNAKQAASDTNKLGVSIDNATNATNENNDSVSQGNAAYKTFKAQLREANQELQKQIQLTGESSQETIKAAKAVADLKDQMGFAADLADSFNPDQKMKALGAATQVAATGVQGVTAGMALFGDQSEDTQKALLKVQAAMAFSDAISGLSDLGDQWQLLKNTISASSVATKANTAATGAAAMIQNLFTGSVNTSSAGFKGLKLAIAGTGIGLLVVGLALVITNFSKLKEVVLKVVPGLASVGKLIGSIVDSVTDFIGVTSEADRAIDRMKSNADASIALNKKFLAEHGSQLDEFTKQKIEAKNKYNEAIKEDGADQVALAKELNRELAKIEYSRGDERRKIAKENAKKAAEDAEKRQKDAKDKRDAKAKEEADALKKIADDKLADEMKSAQDAVNIIEQLKQNIETPAQKEQREYEEKKLILEANNLSTEELTVQHIEKLTQIEKEGRDKKAEEKKASDEKVAAEQKKIDDARLALEESIQQSSSNILERGFGLVRDLFGKNKAIQKAALIAESAIGIGKTIQQASTADAAALAQGIIIGGPIAGPAIATPARILNKVSAGLSVASNIAATAKALQALGGGSAPSASGVSGGGVRGSAPPAVAFNNTAENQIGQSVAKTQSDQPPLKVYVSESDISDAQNNVKVLVNKNVF